MPINNVEYNITDTNEKTEYHHLPVDQADALYEFLLEDLGDEEKSLTVLDSKNKEHPIYIDESNNIRVGSKIFSKENIKDYQFPSFISKKNIEISQKFKKIIEDGTVSLQEKEQFSNEMKVALDEMYRLTAIEIEKILENTYTISEQVKTHDTFLDNLEEEALARDPGWKEAMESGNPAEMLKAFVNILSQLMKIYMGGGIEDTTGYNKLKKVLGKQIDETIIKLSTASPDEIQQEIDTYKEGRKGKGVSKQVAYTYFISALQEFKLTKIPDGGDKPKDRILKHLNDTVQPGDLLILNKHTSSKKAEFGGAMLRAYDGSTPVDYTHAVMVTSVNPIKFSHSTMSKENSSGSGAEGNVDLKTYTSKFENLDIMHLQTNPSIKDGLLANISEDVERGAGYDSGAPVQQFLGEYANMMKEWSHPGKNKKPGFLEKQLQKNLTDDAEKFNCVELIIDNIPGNEKNGITRATHPNDLLKMENLFTMEYMTTYPGGIQLPSDKNQS